MIALDWRSILQEPNTELEGLENKVETFLSRAEGSYNLVEEIHHRDYSTVRMLTLVHRLLRKLSNSFDMRNLFF